MRKLRTAATLLAAAALVLALAGPAAATAGGNHFVVRLNGAAEVAGGQTGAGDLDARGIAVLRRTALAGANDRLCWFIVTQRMALPAVAGHIHGPTAAGSAGLLQTASPIVDFSLANDAQWPRELPEPVGRSRVGQARGCAEYPDATLDAIWASPSQYYVNVHNSAFPAGAIRGQLG